MSKITKGVAKILTPLEESNDSHFIMIEGAPSIKKSVLMREIPLGGVINNYCICLH